MVVGDAAAVDTTGASAVDELVLITVVSFLQAVWAAIICWIHRCWAGLNNGSPAIDTADDDVTVELPDVDVVSAEKTYWKLQLQLKNTEERSTRIDAVALIAIHYAHVQVSM